MIVITDTTPINYLILIGEIDLLPTLYREIVIPEAVVSELSDIRAAGAVKSFANSLPGWARLAKPSRTSVPDQFSVLGLGERQAILLAMEMPAAVVVTDDRAARQVAYMYYVSTMSTLRILADAAELGQISLEEAFAKLRATNFRVDDLVLKQFMKEDADRRGVPYP